MTGFMVLVLATVAALAYYARDSLQSLRRDTQQTLFASIRGEISAAYSSLDALIKANKPRYRELHAEARDYLLSNGLDAPLAPLKRRLEQDAGMPVDIYLIDPEQVVRRTTYPPDQGLDMKQPALLDAQTFIRRAREEEAIVVQPPVLETVARQFRIYSYSPIGGEGWVLELGFVPEAVDEFFRDAEQRLGERAAYDAELFFLMWRDMVLDLHQPRDHAGKQAVIDNERRARSEELMYLRRAAERQAPVRHPGEPTVYYLPLVRITSDPAPPIEVMARVSVRDDAIDNSLEALMSAMALTAALLAAATALLFLVLRRALIKPLRHAARDINRWRPIELRGMAARLRELQILAMRYNAMLGDARSRIEGLDRKASTDPLTGIPNRGRLEAELETELARRPNTGPSWAVVFIDIDHFKRLNDNEGHARGDEVLRRFCRLIGGGVRATDTFGRWGGEEFIVICRGCDLAGAKRLAETLRVGVVAAGLGERNTVTASFGVAAYREGDSLKRLLGRADAAMYAAKLAGRNCVRGEDDLEEPG